MTVEHAFTDDPNVHTLADLVDIDLGPVPWVVEGILPRGLAVFGGRPKIGKSWLLLSLGMAIAGGSPALDEFPTPKGSVLYLALEDSKRRMQSRAKLLGLSALGRDAVNVSIAYEWPQLENGGLEKLHDWLDRHPECRVILIDTWQRFRGEAGTSGKNQYSEDYRIAAEMQQFATQRDVAIIVAHHLRKESAEDWIDQLSGTNGIAGAADTIWGIFRERGQHDATLRITGRDIEERDIALRKDGQSWVSLGDANVWRTTQERKQIYELLKDAGVPMTTGDIAKAIGKSVANASKLLSGLASDGLAHSPKHGRWIALTDLVELVDSVDTESSDSTVSTPLTGGEQEASEEFDALPVPF